MSQLYIDRFKQFGTGFVGFFYYIVPIWYYYPKHHHNLVSIQTAYNQRQTSKRLFYGRGVVIDGRLRLEVGFRGRIPNHRP